MSVGRDMYLFHKAIDAHISSTPRIPDEQTKALRMELIKEEVIRELLPALEQDDLVAIADGAIDAVVVIVGTLISYGIDFEPLWNEVMQTNFAKASGPLREDGKRLKPPGWKAPDIQAILDNQPSLGWVMRWKDQ